MNPIFEEVAQQRGFGRHFLDEIARRGSIRNMPGVPEDIQKVFVTDWDITPEWHIRMQAIFQKYTDNSVSKTINLPQTATREDVRRIYMMAHELRCKGITVYRYGKRERASPYVARRCLATHYRSPRLLCGRFRILRGLPNRGLSLVKKKGATSIAPFSFYQAR